VVVNRLFWKKEKKKEDEKYLAGTVRYVPRIASLDLSQPQRYRE